jgi:hypothetical protein
MNAVAAGVWLEPSITAIGYVAMMFTPSGMAISRTLAEMSGVTSVRYTIPASASPSRTFWTTPFTSSSFETTLANASC